MPEFDATIVKLELWWRRLFLTDEQIKRYMMDVLTLEARYGGIYTMKSLYRDLDNFVLKLLELDLEEGDK